MRSEDIVIEMSPEKKDSIITATLDRYIKGVIGDVGSYVKDWDVVNEPMDDGNPTQLKTGVGKTLAANEFYWQDYMGKDYAAKAINSARQYGSNLRLFINDYNLEYSLDKCKGLIAFVKYTDDVCQKTGVKGVDGIGTQMHLSLTSSRDSIVAMYKLLAATGKLIKITELDMGLGGNPAITTPNATQDLYKAQADLYQFVVQKYFELIPAAQRAGITIWSPFDSPDTPNAWRRNEPIGLWNIDYVRKPAYGGFANGLAGKDISQNQ
jgi:GH35 family endo-1,4-beta-xylanase